MERYTTERLKKIVAKIKERAAAAKEVLDDMENETGRVEMQAKLRAYQECIKIIESEMY